MRFNFFFCFLYERVQMCSRAEITQILFSVNQRGNLRTKKGNSIYFYTCSALELILNGRKNDGVLLMQSALCSMQANIISRCCSLQREINFRWFWISIPCSDLNESKIKMGVNFPFLKRIVCGFFTFNPMHYAQFCETFSNFIPKWFYYS